MQSVDLQVKNEGDLSTFAALGMLFCFIFGFLITHEVSLQDSLKLCAILALDLVTGAVIWILFSRKGEYSVFELLGVGVALGTSLNAIGQLIFRKTIIGSLFNYLFLVFVVLLFIKFRRKNQFVLHFSPTRSSTVLAVCTTALILLCGDRYYLWVGVLVLALALFVLIKFEHTPSLNKFRYFFGVFSLGSIAMALFSSSILENSLFGPRTTTSYIGGWDGVYFEAASKSLINYGPFDNFLIAKNKYAYYWFSDAWSGAYTQRTMVNDWVVTTQFGFIVAAVTTTWLILAISSSWIPKQQYISLSIIPLAATSFVAQPLNLFYLPSFSQVIAILLVTLFLFFLNEFLKFQKKINLCLLMLTGPLIVLTKTLIALPLLVGISTGTAFLVFRAKSIRIYLGLSIISILILITSLTVYITFIKPAKGNSDNYSDFNFVLNGNIFGILSSHILVSSALFLAFPLTVLNILRNHKLLDDFSILLISIAGSSLGITLFLDFNNSQANSYMILPFSLSFLFLAAISIDFTKVFKICINLNLLLPLASSFVFAFASGSFSTIRLHYLNYNFVSSNVLNISAALITYALAVVIGGIFWAIFKSIPLRRQVFGSLVALILASQALGFYFGNSLRPLIKDHVYKMNQWEIDFQDVETEMQRLKNATTFIGTHITLSDLLASNSLTDHGLLTAMTGIRSYASSYAPNLWGGEEHRYIEQDVFGKDPSEKSYSALREGCVSWFYYDKDETPGKAKSFEPYATILYEDEYGAVLKLSESYPIPDECLK